MKKLNAKTKLIIAIKKPPEIADLAWEIAAALDAISPILLSLKNGTGSRTNLAQTAVCKRTSIKASNSTWKNWLKAVIAKLNIAIIITSIATVINNE